MIYPTQSAPRAHVRGFTLIELAIVLVIIGLVVSGVVVGREMILQSELRKLYSEVTRYKTLVSTFRIKFNAIPGDMPNATNFWGNMADCTDWAPVPPTQATCNGNGDGQVLGLSGGTASVAIREQYLFWQHLANAEMIGGAPYPGGLVNAFVYQGYNEIGKLIPALNVRNMGIVVEYEYGGGFSIRGHNHFATGIQFNAGANEIGDVDGSLTPAEAYGFDLKYDDGWPYRGTIQNVSRQGHGSVSPYQCVNYIGSTDGYYIMDNPDQPSCTMIFDAGF